MTDQLPLRRFAQLGAYRVHFLEWPARPDAASAPPILLLHGWPQNAAMWRQVGSALASASGRRLIAPDLRGFGQSETPGYGYNSRDFARDQVALLDRLGIARADVIGHDWGGWTSFMLALRHPDRVGRVLAISTPHPWARLAPARLGGGWRLWYAAANAMPLIGPRLNRIPGYIERILGISVPEQARRAYAANLSQPARAAAVASLYRHYFSCLSRVGRGYWRDRQVRARLHLLFGAEDHLIPASILDGDELRANAPQATLELLPGAGHFLVDERPELVVTRARNLFVFPDEDGLTQ